MAVNAKDLMDTDEEYTKLLEAIQTGNRVKFEEYCNDKGINNATVILQLWAAAVGSQSIEAQAAYPGSSGW